ncbi:MAG: YunC family protein [Bacillota bacterium]
MISMVPLRVGDTICVGISLALPKTNLLVAVAPKGYVMCGLLDVVRLDGLHKDRKIVAARVTGVSSPEDILTAKVDGVTAAARELGVVEGMSGEEALSKMV